jgi:O-succinylbenzoic acid--CoA ligase
MTRPLIRVGAGDPLRLLTALRAALDGSGPAVQPVDEGPTALSAPARSAPSGDRAAAETAAERVPDEVAVVIATSGSSGYPKRVALSASALLASARATEGALGGARRWVLAMPAHYVAGVQVLVRSIVAGSTPVAVGDFSEEAFVRATATARAGAARTSTALVPAQVASLLSDAAGTAALASLDAVIVGGQAVPAALRERAQAAGVRLVRSYGSSETAGGCVYDGRPLDGVDVRIVDGEIRIGGPTLALGYLDDPDRTAAAFPETAGRRWFRTGDTGVITEDGLVEVAGRIDNVIVSGGINVSLDRVEAVVRDRPGLGDAVVVAADDERWGSVPVVVVGVGVGARAGVGVGAGVVAGAGAEAGEDLLDDLRAEVGARLGVAARPARIVRVASVPLLSSGKPDRRAVRRLVAELDRVDTRPGRRPTDG